MKNLSAHRLYTRVARLGSFSAAARECGLSQPQASRIIADLEADLGVRLLSRTTRAVVPTEAGAAFLARIEPLLVALDEAENDVRDDGVFRGLLRMSMPTSFGVRSVIPRLPGFAERHRDLRIQIQLADRRQDLVRQAVDVAFRLGRLVDSSATARLVAAAPRVIIASPDYLAAHGAPAEPDDLSRHRIVGGTASAVPAAWAFERGGRRVKLELEPHFATDDNEGAVAAATAGLGVTSTSGWACRRELEAGQLVRLLRDWSLEAIPVHAYFPLGRDTRAAARAVVEHLAAGFRAEEDFWA